MSPQQNWLNKLFTQRLYISIPLGGTWWTTALAVILAISIGLLLSLIITLVVLYQSSLILPGVQVMGVDIGGLTKTEAQTLLQNIWHGQSLTLTTEETTLTVFPEMLGFMIKKDLTIDIAYQQGRSWQSFRESLQTNGPIHIEPIWYVDPLIAEINLRSLAPQFNIAPIEAFLSIEAGRAKAKSAHPGQRLDVQATVAHLTKNSQQILAHKQVSLILAPVPPMVSSVDEAVAQINQLFSRPLTLHTYDPISDETLVWVIPPETWGTWLTFHFDPQDPNQFEWTLIPETTLAYLAEQVTLTDPTRYLDQDEALLSVEALLRETITPKVLRIYHYQRTHTVQAGETISRIAYQYGMPFPYLQQANPDLGDQLYVGQTIIIPSADIFLPLPIVENKRIIISLAEQRMWTYENEALIWDWPTSSGIESSPTSPGVYQIQSHEENAYGSSWDLWMPYFMGIYHPGPHVSLMNGFHGFPTRDGRNLLWTGNLGTPVTYGCLLLETGNAKALYEWAEEGVVVEIRE